LEERIMRLGFALLSLALVIVSARPSIAQESGQVGVTMAYPASIGVIWHATDELAIRPDFTFSNSESGSLASSTTQGGIGVSALYYVRKWDNLRAYVSPRFGYQHASLTSGSSSSLTTSSNNYSYSGSFGAEYLLHRRFAVFAETGFGYTRSTSGSSSALPALSFQSDSHNWGTRAGVGAIFYF
jgi:hypothetical protein